MFFSEFEVDFKKKKKKKKSVYFSVLASALNMQVTLLYPSEMQVTQGYQIEYWKFYQIILKITNYQVHFGLEKLSIFKHREL